MRYSYVVTGNGLYIPQFKNGDKEWEPFTKGMIKGDMLTLCRCLGDISAPRKWTSGQWHFESEGLKSHDDESIFFTKPMYAMAFIGAAQHWWGSFGRTEVDLNFETK